MITIIDYGMGNVGSIANMLKYLGYESEITSNITTIKNATKLILPGVGHFDKAMSNIEIRGLKNIIIHKSLIDKTPILGICLGMQILCNHSEEGTSTGLQLIDADVIRFRFDNSTLKVPHMGWNLIEIKKDIPLIKDLQQDPRFYFVHSFYVKCNNNENILTTTNYGNEFHSSFSKENIYGVQFHPEKSHKFGMKLLDNFAKI